MKNKSPDVKITFETTLDKLSDGDNKSPLRLTVTIENAEKYRAWLETQEDCTACNEHQYNKVSSKCPKHTTKEPEQRTLHDIVSDVVYMSAEEAVLNEDWEDLVPILDNLVDIAIEEINES